MRGLVGLRLFLGDQMKATSFWFCWILLVACGRIDAAEYYASPTASSHGDGSFEAPWSTLTHALEQLRAGDTLYLRGGTFYESEISVSLRGTADSKIVIRSYPGERATIFGQTEAVRTAHQRPGNSLILKS